MSGNTIQAALGAMTPEQRRGALVMLDHISRPLTVREIEKMLRVKGVPLSRAKIIAIATKGFHIIAMIGGEEGTSL